MNDDEWLALAREVREWIDRSGTDPDALTASINGRLHHEVARVFPAARHFGRAVLRAATGTDGCRWCAARSDQRALKLLTPGRFRALRGLLGEPCGACVQWARERARAQVEASAVVAGGRAGAGDRHGGWEGRRVAGAPSSSARQSGTASPFPHSTGTCVTCFQAMQAGRGALTASAARDALTAAAAPHARVLAPTGVVQPLIHNGRGALANCNCEECRGARIIEYRDRKVIP